MIWQPSGSLLRQHNSSALLYTVRLAVSPESAVAEAWDALGREPGGDGLRILDGGASLIRLPDGVIEAVSGGEDALDSLQYTINETLAEALPAGTSVEVLDVVREKRR